MLKVTRLSLSGSDNNDTNQSKVKGTGITAQALIALKSFHGNSNTAGSRISQYNH